MTWCRSTSSSCRRSGSSSSSSWLSLHILDGRFCTSTSPRIRRLSGRPSRSSKPSHGTARQDTCFEIAMRSTAARFDSGSRHGDRTGPQRTAKSVAEPVRGATHRNPAPRLPRSCHRSERTSSQAYRCPVSRLLPRLANAPFLVDGRTEPADGTSAGPGQGGRVSGTRRPASPLRTLGSVKGTARGRRFSGTAPSWNDDQFNTVRARCMSTATKPPQVCSVRAH